MAPFAVSNIPRDKTPIFSRSFKQKLILSGLVDNQVLYLSNTLNTIQVMLNLYKPLNKLVVYALLPLFILFSCQPADEPALLDDGNPELLSLEETLASYDDGSDDAGEEQRGFRRGPRFRTLTKALVITGLAPVIVKNRVTVFAPTDRAFKKLGITPKNVAHVDNLKENFIIPCS